MHNVGSAGILILDLVYSNGLAWLRKGLAWLRKGVARASARAPVPCLICLSMSHIQDEGGIPLDSESCGGAPDPDPRHGIICDLIICSGGNLSDPDPRLGINRLSGGGGGRSGFFGKK